MNVELDKHGLPLRKSRKGCNTCKLKRRKCDEHKPFCFNCLKRQIQCGGYATQFKWRSFDTEDDKKDTKPEGKDKDREKGDKSSSKKFVKNDEDLSDKRLKKTFAGTRGTTNMGTPVSRSTSESGYASGTHMDASGNEYNVPSGAKSNGKGSKPDGEFVFPVKVEPALLQHHLELASLSVVGKSTRDIKFDNELIARGINPHTFEGRRPSDVGQRMQRTRMLHRSASQGDAHAEMAAFRCDVRRSYTLDSLAEAAADQMRRPDSSPFDMGRYIKRATPPGSPATISPQRIASDPLQKQGEIEGMDNRNQNQNEHASNGQSDLAPNEHSLTQDLAQMQESRSLERQNEHESMQQNGQLLTNRSHQMLKNDQMNRQMGNVHLIENTQMDIEDRVTKFNGPKFEDISGTSPRLENGVKFSNGGAKFQTMGPKFMPNIGPLHQHMGSPLELSPLPVQLTPSLSALLSSVFPDERNAPSPLDLVLDEPLRLLLDVALRLGSRLAHAAEQEQILALYLAHTCGIMSIKNGAHENPWRTVFVGLAAQHLYLFNLIASMTLFHLAGNINVREYAEALRAKGYVYMKKCILELAARLSKMDTDSENALPADIALATCLNLAVSESWDTHTLSGIAHLKGAKSMIHKVLAWVRAPETNRAAWLAEARRHLVLVSPEEWARIGTGEARIGAGDTRRFEHVSSTSPGSNSNQISPVSTMPVSTGSSLIPSMVDAFVPRNLQLLFNTWVYFDVLSQMTSHLPHDDKGIDLVAAITKSGHAEEESPRSEDAPFAFFELDLMLHSPDHVDPLLGCAQSLFLIMARVAALIGRARQTRPGQRNSLANITAAAELRKQLVDWKPMVSLQAAERHSSGDNSTWDLYLCVATAEAYRHATLLHLYQAVPEIPLVAPHLLAEKIFVLLAAVPSLSNVHIVHIFPLLVGSCEAEPGEEREWCEARWALLRERLWIGNVDRALEVVREVWRRKDEARARDDESFDDEGASHRCHWGTVMREWGWEVLLA